MSDTRRLVDKLWSFCNVLRDDGVSTIEYTEQLTYLNVPQDGHAHLDLTPTLDQEQTRPRLANRLDLLQDLGRDVGPQLALDPPLWQGRLRGQVAQAVL